MSGLTPQEQEVIQSLGEIWNNLCQLVGDGPTRDADLAELIVPLHALQRAVMAQAAARSYPEKYRLLGERLCVSEADEPLVFPWDDRA